MTTQVHPLGSYFYALVQDTFETKAGLRDAEITAYVAQMLCDFSEPDNLYRLHDGTGRRLEDLNEMARAADPVFGTAASFDEERAVRRYMGDYALFVAGMCHEAVKSAATAHADGPTLTELIEAGKKSYAIVSQFNVFEYEKEAQLFARLSNDFERCILGLALVREEMADRKMPLLAEC